MVLLESFFRVLIGLIVSFLKVFYEVDSCLGLILIFCKVLIDFLSIECDSFLFVFTIFHVFVLILEGEFFFD